MLIAMGRLFYSGMYLYKFACSKCGYEVSLYTKECHSPPVGDVCEGCESPTRDEEGLPPEGGTTEGREGSMRDIS